MRRVVLGLLFIVVLCVLSINFLIPKNYDLLEKEYKAQQIYTELLKYTGAPYVFNPGLIIANTAIINAWTDGENVTITTGMLEFLENDSEIAFILGHEIGHGILGHLVSVDSIDQRLKESNADKYGVYLVLRAGYNPCNGYQIWHRFKEKFGNGLLTLDHPSEADREDSLKFPMCS